MFCINTFKRSMILIAVIATAINTCFGQSYFHSPNDTIVGTAVFDDVSVFNITQVHPTADTISFKWRKESVVMPATWEGSICDNGNCYTTLRDSGMMAAIVAGDNGLMSLHLNPHFETGTGTIRYTIFATNTPAQVDTLTWIITAVAPNAIAESLNAEPIISYNNRQIVLKNIDDKFTRVALYDLNGKLLLEQTVQSAQIIFRTDEYADQLLIIQLTGKQNLVTKFFNY